MKRKKRTGYIIGIVLLLGILAIIYGYIEFNRKNSSISNEQPDYILNTNELLEAFNTNEEAATKKYNGKILQVTGMIKSAEKKPDNGLMIVLGDHSSSSSVQCSIDSSSVPEASKRISLNQVIHIKGICTGYLADDSGLGIGSDVILNRCVIVKL